MKASKLSANPHNTPKVTVKLGKKRKPQQPQKRASAKHNTGKPKDKKPVNAVQSRIADATTHNNLNTSAASNPINIKMQNFPMYEYCAAIISYAVQHGWGAITAIPENPGYALVQLAVVICEYIQSENKTSLIIPEFIAEVVARLMVQETNHNNMLVNFKFHCDFNPAVFGIKGDLGPEPRYINFGVPSNTYVNDLWPEVNLSAVYNPELGAQALQSLWTFFSDMYKQNPANSRFRMVSIIDVYEKIKGDGSGYAWNISNVGSNSGATGGMLVVSACESPLLTPQMACWYAIPSTGLPASRSVAFTNTTSASPGLLAVMAMQGTVPWSITKRVGPIFHPLDFGEFLMRVSVWLNLAAQTSADDPQNQEFPLSIYTLDISPLDWLLLWRSVWVSINGDAQQAAQFLFPYTASSPVPFKPFVVGPNVGPCGYNGTGPQLPQSYYENIYAIGITNAYLKIKKGKVVPGGRIYAPMVGLYDDLLPDLVNYTITRGESEVPQFKVPAVVVKQKNGNNRGSKEITEEKVSIEIQINPLDGSYPGNKIAQIGNADSLNFLTIIYNKYVDTLIKPFSGVMCGPSPDGGILALKLPGAFSFSQYAVNDDEDAARRRRLLARVGFKALNDPYGSILRRSTNYTSQVNSACEELFNSWQFPNWLSSNGQNAVDTENLTKLRIYGKTQIFIPDDVNKGTSLVAIALKAAGQNVKARNGEKTESDILLESFAIMGDGSILPMIEAALSGINIVTSLLGARAKNGSFSPMFAPT